MQSHAITCNHLDSLQVDNQRYNTAYPVSLATSGGPALVVRAVRDVSFRKRTFVYMPLLQLHVQPMSVMLDEESIRAFVSFLGARTPVTCHCHVLISHPWTPPVACFVPFLHVPT